MDLSSGARCALLSDPPDRPATPAHLTPVQIRYFDRLRQLGTAAAGSGNLAALRQVTDTLYALSAENALAERLRYQAAELLVTGTASWLLTLLSQGLSAENSRRETVWPPGSVVATAGFAR